MRHHLLLAFALVLLLPLAASAQSLGSTDPFTISVNPEYPTPFSQATLSFLSSSLNLANATIAVSVGGKSIYKGSVQPVSVPLGGAGSVTTVRVTVSSGGATYSQSVVLQPQEVSLIAEPTASMPVLYPGKPLVPLSGSTRVVAIAGLKDARGKTLDPSTLSYAWTVDSVQMANFSGIGKNVLLVASPLQYRARSVSVVVQSPSGSLVGGGSLSLSPALPTVRIYENDPLLGIRFDHALSGTYAIPGTEASLYAAPFSFPLTGSAPSLQWFLNGAPAQTGSSITLRPSGNGQGNASLSLTASSGSLATALASLSLSFGAKSSTNFFGL
ncbi:MAG: hypothetical protein ACYCZZ_01850 [Minisyncoccota bacterium]